MFISTAELASGPPKSMKLQFRPDFRGPDLHQCCAARSAASGKRKRPPAQRKIFGFHNPHYRFPDTELSGIRARTPRQIPISSREFLIFGDRSGKRAAGEIFAISDPKCVDFSELSSLSAAADRVL